MSYPWNTEDEKTLQAAEAVLHEAERFVRRLTTWVTQLRLLKASNTSRTYNEGADTYAAAKRSSLDLTKQLAKFRREEA